MLIHRVGETLIIKPPIGETIHVTVTGLNGNQVRLGTETPRKIVVRREELESLKESA